VKSESELDMMMSESELESDKEENDEVKKKLLPDN